MTRRFILIARADIDRIRASRVRRVLFGVFSVSAIASASWSISQLHAYLSSFAPRLEWSGLVNLTSSVHGCRSDINLLSNRHCHARPSCSLGRPVKKFKTFRIAQSSGSILPLSDANKLSVVDSRSVISTISTIPRGLQCVSDLTLLRFFGLYVCFFVFPYQGKIELIPSLSKG